MAIDRLEVLKDILSQRPGDTLARYGLAMEYIKAANYELAVAEFRNLLTSNPDHAYAYFYAGQALEKLDRRDEAREMYKRGVEAASRQANAHAREKLQAALDQILRLAK